MTCKIIVKLCEKIKYFLGLLMEPAFKVQAYNFPIEWPLERVNDAEHCITLLISPSTMECIAGEQKIYNRDFVCEQADYTLKKNKKKTIGKSN